MGRRPACLAHSRSSMCDRACATSRESVTRTVVTFDAAASTIRDSFEQVIPEAKGPKDLNQRGGGSRRRRRILFGVAVPPVRRQDRPATERCSKVKGNWRVSERARRDGGSRLSSPLEANLKGRPDERARARHALDVEATADKRRPLGHAEKP